MKMSFRDGFFRNGVALSVCVLSLLFIPLDSQSQQHERRQIEEAVFVITPTIGLSWRSTVVGLSKSKARLTTPTFFIPYNYEKNIQGVSLNPSVEVYIRPARLSIEYAPNLRYDHLYNIWSDTCHWMQLDVNPRPMCHYPLLDEIKGFIVDHNFNFFIRLGESKDKRKTRVGLGLSFVNAGKDFTSRNEQNYWNLAFTTYNLVLQIPVKKRFTIEPKVLYIPHDFPNNPAQRHLSFSLRTFYNFNSLVL